jgi:hypothetical protein
MVSLRVPIEMKRSVGVEVLVGRKPLIEETLIHGQRSRAKGRNEFAPCGPSLRLYSLTNTPSPFVVSTTSPSRSVAQK